ncbi:MAG: methyltransferase [Acidimicrobiales bacterium]
MARSLRIRAPADGTSPMPAHYFDPVPAVASARRTVELALPDLTVALQTDRGVFSADRVDPGTKLLLQEAPAPPATGDLLDLGCGYGPIAVALGLRSPGARVWGVDINERARELAARNAAVCGAGNVTVGAPDMVPSSLRFAACYTNPPIRVGKTSLHALLDDWVPRCAIAYLVVNKNLGSDSLASWMTHERGWAVERLVSRMGFRILGVTP